MEKYDFIKCKKCGEPLNKIIYGLPTRGQLPKHTVVTCCEKSKYIYECSNYDCKTKYTKRDLFNFSFLPFVKPKLKSEVEVGYDKEWDEVVKQRIESLSQNFESILNELNNLEPNTSFTFNKYFDEYNIPNKDRLDFYFNLTCLLEGGVEVTNEMKNAVAGLPYNIPHIRNEKQVEILDPKSKAGITKMLNLLKSEKLCTFIPPKEEGGIIIMGSVNYSTKLTNYLLHFSCFENQCLQNFKEVDSKEVDTLTETEIRLYITTVYRNERRSTGLIQNFVESGKMESMLTKYLEYCSE